MSKGILYLFCVIKFRIFSSIFALLPLTAYHEVCFYDENSQIRTGFIMAAISPTASVYCQSKKKTQKVLKEWLDENSNVFSALICSAKKFLESKIRFFSLASGVARVTRH